MPGLRLRLLPLLAVPLAASTLPAREARPRGFSQGDVDRGVARCRQELERRGLDVRRVVSARREGKNNVAVVVSARRGSWAAANLRCTWDAGKNRAWRDGEPGPG